MVPTQICFCCSMMAKLMSLVFWHLSIVFLGIDFLSIFFIVFSELPWLVVLWLSLILKFSSVITEMFHLLLYLFSFQYSHYMYTRLFVIISLFLDILFHFIHYFFVLFNSGNLLEYLSSLIFSFGHIQPIDSPIRGSLHSVTFFLAFPFDSFL